MNWKPVDYIIVILAVPLAAILLVAVIGPNLLGAKPSSPEKLQIMGNIVSSLIGVISVYVGSKMQNKE